MLLVNLCFGAYFTQVRVNYQIIGFGNSIVFIPTGARCTGNKPHFYGNMGITMRKINLFAGALIALSGMFASQTFAATGCEMSACDPAAAAAACGPAAAAANCAPAAGAASCDPNANSGCVAPASCAAADTCFDPSAFALGQQVRRSLCESVCWSGYINAGYDTNCSGDRSNGYVDCFNNTTPAFNALYLSATKKAFTGGCGFDWGFGVDFMFGEDARLMQSARGWDDSWDTGSMYNPMTGAYDRDSYGFAMPQFYAEVAMNNWSLKMGHFYGLLGYEGVKATDRFFYTKGLGFQVTPITQTGILASYNGFENLDVTLGWVNGWGNGFDNSEYAEGAFTGAFTYHVNQYTSFKYAFQTGTTDMTGALGFAGPYAGKYAYKGVGSMHNVVLDLQLTDRFESVSTLHYGDYGLADDTTQGCRFLVLGQHFYYTMNSCWKLGMRAEWLKATNYYGEKSIDTECTSLAFGANWKPCGWQNLTVRPELRYDRAIDGYSVEALNGRLDQITLGIDAVLNF